MEFKSVKIFARSYHQITTAKNMLEGQDYFLSRARIIDIAMANFVKALLKLNEIKNGK